MRYVVEAGKKQRTVLQIPNRRKDLIHHTVGPQIQSDIVTYKAISERSRHAMIEVARWGVSLACTDTFRCSSGGAVDSSTNNNTAASSCVR